MDQATSDLWLVDRSVAAKQGGRDEYEAQGQ